MIIKAILVAAAIGCIVVVMRDRWISSHVALRRLGGIAVVAVAIAAVLWPGLTTKAAQLVGVGRGTDLVLYVLVVLFGYHALVVSQRIHALERSITILTRELALSRRTESEERLPAPVVAGVRPDDD